jgi:hypothetical protein
VIKQLPGFIHLCLITSALTTFATILLWSEGNRRCVTSFTKIVALSMQMLDRKPSEEPVLTVEEQPIEYEA